MRHRQVFLYYLVVSIVLTILYNEKTKQKGRKDVEFRNKTEEVSGLTSELVRGVKDIKMLNAKNSFMTKLEGNVKEQNQKRFDMAKVNMYYNYIIDTLRAVFELGLILLLIYLVQNSTISIAIAIALFNYKSGIMTVIMEQISGFLDIAKDFNISCDRVFRVLEEGTFEKEHFGNKHLTKVEGNFEFKDVSFEYVQGKTILEHLNFKVNAGEILIENENINELDEDSIRGNITIISQNPYIFNLSIRDNLKLVKDDLKEEEMVEACKIACLHDFIESLPNKYDTIVGESGVILSGGQKQRLVIARALIQKTKIILFDEATSALDNETQSEIQKAIFNLKDRYTILIIAHRLSTIINCDRIMVIENGRIADQGNHEDLLNRNNLYKTLYQTEILK